MLPDSCRFYELFSMHHPGYPGARSVQEHTYGFVENNVILFFEGWVRSSEMKRIL